VRFVVIQNWKGHVSQSTRLLKKGLADFGGLSAYVVPLGFHAPLHPPCINYLLGLHIQHFCITPVCQQKCTCMDSFDISTAHFHTRCFVLVLVWINRFYFMFKFPLVTSCSDPVTTDNCNIIKELLCPQVDKKEKKKKRRHRPNIEKVGDKINKVIKVIKLHNKLLQVHFYK